jgi:2',3'-cyclic-nucleotide 2'-phosphodiesterase (5'-nucleotidase family)
MMKYTKLLLANLIVALFFLQSCAGLFSDKPEADREHDFLRVAPEYIMVDESIGYDAEMDAFIRAYASDLFRYMGRFLVKSTGVIERGQPESPLGNLTADILLNRATREMGFQVDIAILNRGGLRIPLPEGDVTVGTIYELMPFENHITMLKFNGRQIRQLANEIAIEGGEPLSGMRMRIRNGVAEDLLVAGTSVRDNRLYWVATNNWLADGGGDMPTLWNPIERRDLDVMLRDAFIEYLAHQPEIGPVTDNRVRN